MPSINITEESELPQSMYLSKVFLLKVFLIFSHLSFSYSIEKLTFLANKLEYLYIADGHHRIEAIRKLYQMKSSQNSHHTGSEGYNYFMISAFPKSQSKIYDYNRVIKDLNTLSVNEFTSCIKENFECENSSLPVRPKQGREFGMYHDGKWYLLKFKNESLINDDILSKLDINIIDNFCLKTILGIKDVNADVLIVAAYGLIIPSKILGI